MRRGRLEWFQYFKKILLRKHHSSCRIECEDTGLCFDKKLNKIQTCHGRSLLFITINVPNTQATQVFVANPSPRHNETVYGFYHSIRIFGCRKLVGRNMRRAVSLVTTERSHNTSPPWDRNVFRRTLQQYSNHHISGQR